MLDSKEMNSVDCDGGIGARFKLTGELRRPRKGEWYWWTGSRGPAALKADADRDFNAPILMQRGTWRPADNSHRGDGAESVAP